MQVADGIELSYGCDASALSTDLAARFVALDCDADARAFIDGSLSSPHGALRTALYRLLRTALSDYDAYGLLGMYPMHLLSTDQLSALLGEHARGHLLDVGAGDGGITAQAAALCESVSATEQSRMLSRRLRARGYRVLDHDLALAPLPNAERFDLVMCLNVLDRCLRPRSLLSNLRTALAPDARLLLSVPLPLRAHVHVGPRTVDPDEPLPSPERSWEAGVQTLERALLAPAGLAVERFTRLPYLCRGDSRAPMHVLDTVTFVLEASPADARPAASTDARAMV